jgi:hypothetical protein
VACAGEFVVCPVDDVALDFIFGAGEVFVEGVKGSEEEELSEKSLFSVY